MCIEIFVQSRGIMFRFWYVGFENPQKSEYKTYVQLKKNPLLTQIPVCPLENILNDVN